MDLADETHWLRFEHHERRSLGMHERRDVTLGQSRHASEHAVEHCFDHALAVVEIESLLSTDPASSVAGKRDGKGRFFDGERFVARPEGARDLE